MLLNRWTKSVTPVAGVYTINPIDDSGLIGSGNYKYKMNARMLNQVLVRSATPATTFDVSIEDFEGISIRAWTTAVGVINDLTPTPVVGNITLKITNASADEAFQLLLIWVD